MFEFFIDLMIVKMLLLLGDFGCLKEIFIIVVMLQIQNVFVSLSKQKVVVDNVKRKFFVYEGDYIILLNVYEVFVKFKKSLKWCYENFLNYKGFCYVVKIREQFKKFFL